MLPALATARAAAAVVVPVVVERPVALGLPATTATATPALGKLKPGTQTFTAISLTFQKRAREAGRSRLGLPGGYL